MVKLMFCLVRRADVDEAEFHRYWRDEHAPLVATHAEVLGLRRYVQAHAVHPHLNAALAATRGAPASYDGVAELWVDSVDAMMHAAATPAGVAASQALLDDERRFIDHARSPIFLTEERSILPA